MSLQETTSKKMKRNTFVRSSTWLLFSLTIFLTTSSTIGHPASIEPDARDATTTTTAPTITTNYPIETTTTTTTSLATEDDVERLSSSSSSLSSAPIEFLDVPAVHTESVIGASVLLECRTIDPVLECQWSWQPLPPKHLPSPDVSEIPITSTETLIDLNSTKSVTPTTPALPVRRFSAFGSNDNDCSVRFSSVKHEQAGFWTCAARKNSSDPFFGTKPAKLTILGDDQVTDVPISFEKHPLTVEASVGTMAQIKCLTDVPVKECQWSWRQLNQTDTWNLEVKSFPAFGNDSRDCSIKFKNVLAEQEGFWTCGARINPKLMFTRSNPIRFVTTEVKFVQLSQGIEIAAGETVLLRCIVNKPVVQCEWSWKPMNSSRNRTIVKKFPPNKDSENDCSVRFRNILYEEEGLWTCGVRLTTDGQVREAPPTVVSLLPPAKVSFVEAPENTSVPAGSEVTLKCVANTRVGKCSWAWKSLGSSEDAKVVEEFPSKGDLGRDCSLTLPRVSADQEGQWSCHVWLSPQNIVQPAPPMKLIVFKPEPVTFSELSQDIQISSGGTVLLRCVTSSTVEQCRWSLTPANSNTTVVVKQFPAAGTESRDCSVRLSHALAEQEGLWTCGARLRGQEYYTNASPAKLSLLQPEPVSIALWTTLQQTVSLACRLQPFIDNSQCHWLHAPDVHLRQKNLTKIPRYAVHMNHSSGICKLQFKPSRDDLGEWTCMFTIDHSNETSTELGSVTLVLLNVATDETLSWIVGALTTFILFLMIIVVVVVVFWSRLFARDPHLPKVLETASASQRRRRPRDVSEERYVEGPDKINFSFPEQISQTLDTSDVRADNKRSTYNERDKKYQGEPSPGSIYANIIETT